MWEADIKVNGVQKKSNIWLRSHKKDKDHGWSLGWRGSQRQQGKFCLGGVLFLLTILEIPQNILRKPSSWRQVIMGMITSFAGKKKKKNFCPIKIWEFLIYVWRILFLFLSHIFHPYGTLPLLHFSRISPSPFPLPQIYPFFCLPSATSVKHDITVNNKPRHLPSHKQPRRGLRSHKQAKESETVPVSLTVRSPTGTPRYPVITYIWRTYVRTLQAPRSLQVPGVLLSWSCGP